MDRLEPPTPSPSREVPDPVWPSTAWPAGPVGPPPAGQGSAPPPKRRSDRSAWVMALLGGVLLGTGVTLGVLGLLDRLPNGPVEAAPATTVTMPTTTTRPPVAEGSVASITDVAAAAIPSIVAVEIVGEEGFVVGGGSGVVYSEDGYLVTNNHVVADAAEIVVVFSDGVSYPAEVLGTDPLTDIAVISTSRSDVVPIRLGTEADLVIGERTVAVGNPLGLLGGPSVTSGILSATGRSLDVEAGTVLYGLLQTDAPITRGSSGGALVDQEAKLIGITTAIGVSDVGAEGLGFAVPVDLVISVAEDLIVDGVVRHGMLGITGSTVTEARQEAAIPLGVGVRTVAPGSGYAEAGGEVGDVIIQVEGEPMTSIEQLIARLRHHRAGDEVQMRVLRDDQELTFGVVLGEYQGG